MLLPRPGHIQRELRDFGRVYLIAIAALLLGLLFKGVLDDVATSYPLATAAPASGPFLEETHPR